MRRSRRRGRRIALAVFAGALALVAAGAPVARAADAPVRGVTNAPVRVQDAARDASARNAVPITIANPGFEEATPQGPAGWNTAQHAGVPSYAFTSDDKVAKSGRRSARIDNIGPEPFGVLYQALPAAPHVGKRLRFTAMLRAQDIAGKGYNGAFLLVQAMRAGVPVAEDRMMDRPLRGTRDWHQEKVELVIPEAADQIEIGVMLLGAGTVWIDDARLEIVPAP